MTPHRHWRSQWHTSEDQNRQCHPAEEAAILLGIGERTLYRKIKEYDIKA